MNIVFIRHGEASDNVKQLISDKEIYWSVLTDLGIKTVKETVKSLPSIDKAYVSPFPRTIQTASIVRERFPNIDYVIDNRIREINYGKYSGKKNNEDVDKVRELQALGDYFIRFGEYGENKFEIEARICNFLLDLRNNDENATILVVSHNTIISFMKRILSLKKQPLETGKSETFNNVDFNPAIEFKKNLDKIGSK